MNGTSYNSSLPLITFLTVRMGNMPPPGSVPPGLTATPDNQVPRSGVLEQAQSVASTLSSGSRTPNEPLSTTATLMNLLLPDKNSEKRQPKVWVGVGLPPIPKKLHDRILRWEYIDFYDLRPVDPLEDANPEPDPVQYVMFPDLEIARTNRKKIKDLPTWTACFALYVAILSSKFPSCVPSMMAYQLCILKAHREYADPAWRVYDEAFREVAAATGLRDWSKNNDDLYSRIFTGRAKVVTLCTHCGSTTHPTDQCKNEPVHKKARISTSSSSYKPLPRQRGKNICWDFNEGHCTFNPCKYRHVCSDCSGRHPRIHCKHNSSRGQTQDKQNGGGQGRRAQIQSSQMKVPGQSWD